MNIFAQRMNVVVSGYKGRREVKGVKNRYILVQRSSFLFTLGFKVVVFQMRYDFMWWILVYIKWFFAFNEKLIPSLPAACSHQRLRVKLRHREEEKEEKIKQKTKKKALSFLRTYVHSSSQSKLEEEEDQMNLNFPWPSFTFFTTPQWLYLLYVLLVAFVCKSPSTRRVGTKYECVRTPIPSRQY